MDREGGKDLPTGTVTFLYTDIEGSSRLHEAHPKRMGHWHEVHNRRLTDAISACGGHVYRFTGDGYCAAFPTAEAALRAAMDAQRALGREGWDDEFRIRVRMAIFAGPVEYANGEYSGRTLSRGSRLLNAAHGGQTLLNRAAVELLPSRTPTGVDLRELGPYVLQGGVGLRETLYQAVPEEHEATFPPLVAHKGAVRADSMAADAWETPRPFFGRTKEVKELRRILVSRERRLVTVTGLGGTGKSRLSREVARAVEPDFPDGRWFVPCEAIQGPEELTAAIAAAMDLSDARGDPERSVAAGLGDRTALLVLDGFEGMTKDASVVDRLLAAAPRLRVLATSRWPLGLAREAEYPLGPLDASAEARLFLNAASYAAPLFRATKADAAVIERICARLDGVPLAIVVAAGCLKWCGLGALEGIIQTDILDIEGPEGHRSSLRSVIVASIRALPEEDRGFLLRLVAFRGSFDADDVGAVLDLPRGAAFARIARLRDFSLVQAEAGEDRARFRLLNVVRETLDRLAAHERPEASAGEDRRRHLALCLSKAERMPGDPVWMLRSLADFREAFDRAEEWGDEAAVRSLARSLTRPALEMGLWNDFERWVALAVPRAEAAADWPLAMRLLGLEGARAQRAKDSARARDRWGARLDMARRVGDAYVAADAEFDLANVAWASGDRAAMAVHLERVGRAGRELGNEDLAALALSLEAVLACDEGDHARARRCADSALAMGAAQEGQHAFFFVSHKAGNVLRRLGAYREAEAVHLRMLRAAATGRHVHDAEWAFLELARLYRETGDRARAALALRGGHAVLASTGARLKAEMEDEARSLEPDARKGVLAKKDWIASAEELLKN